MVLQLIGVYLYHLLFLEAGTPILSNPKPLDVSRGVDPRETSDTFYDRDRFRMAYLFGHT